MTGEEWVGDYCDRNNIDYGTLTKAERFKITALVPCNVRCFRVGGPTSAEMGSDGVPVCPECGQEMEIPTFYQRIRGDIEVV